jgi:protein gp37
MRNSKIEWTDHTFNPWYGCQKVSPGCDNCYAERDADHRWGLVQWGPHGKRRLKVNWDDPLCFNAEADTFEREHGRRQRVFCLSWGDVFDNKAPPGARSDLWRLIKQTPRLDWCLLTKRPQNIRKMLPSDWGDGWYHVWLGTTCESQEYYEHRWSVLAHIPATLRFISYEPALGPLRLKSCGGRYPDWVICGGESGAGVRRMELEWARALRDECRAIGVPFFMKQLGSNSGLAGITGKGNDPAQWPADLRVLQYPKREVAFV